MSGQDCQWALSDPQSGVGKRHARILFVSGRYFVTDISSKVFVAEDSRPLGAGTSAALRTGDRLRIGPYRIVVEQARGASAAAPAGSLPSPRAALLDTKHLVDARTTTEKR